jgi:hypothetical protein
MHSTVRANTYLHTYTYFFAGQHSGCTAQCTCRCSCCTHEYEFMADGCAKSSAPRRRSRAGVWPYFSSRRFMHRYTRLRKSSRVIIINAFTWSFAFACVCVDTHMHMVIYCFKSGVLLIFVPRVPACFETSHTIDTYMHTFLCIAPDRFSGPTNFLHIHAYVHACTHTHTHTRIYLCAAADHFSWSTKFLHIYVHTCMHTHTHTHTYAYVYVQQPTISADQQNSYVAAMQQVRAILYVCIHRYIYTCIKKCIIFNRRLTKSPDEQNFQVSYIYIHIYIYIYIYILYIQCIHKCLCAAAVRFS